MVLEFLRSQFISENVTSFIFQPERAVVWKPGQYFHYVLDHPNPDSRGNERWFTNSAAPSEGHIVISTRIDEENGSSFKRALKRMKPGDKIFADGPEGDFTVDDYSRNYIFVAGGIGITPFRSILVEAQAQSKMIKAILLYANRTTNVPFSGELDRIAAKNNGLKIEYVIQPRRIDIDTINKYLDSVKNPFVYVSGPKPMVISFASQLEAIGLEKENIKLDDFPGYRAD